MTIIDNRIQITNADALNPAGDGIWEDDAGAFMVPDLSSADVNVIVEGTDAIAHRVSNNDNGLLFNTEVVNDWSNNFFYLWLNMLQPNILDFEINGGMTVRFTGATVTDFFEVNVGGVDTYPGGWKMFVIDIEAAAATPDLIGGTPPATSAIQRIGAHWRAISNSPGANNNCLVDAIWRLPVNTPGVVVTGQKGGVGGVPYTIQDIIDAADNTDPTKAWGVIERLKNGTISLNTPIQVGAFAGPGSPNAGLGSPILTEFIDTNEVLGWELQRVPNEFYGITVAAGSPITTNFTLGVKTGTGDDATGTQGFVITTAERPIAGSPSSPSEDPGGTLIRWFMDLTNQNIDAGNLYGCSLIGSGTLQFDNPIVEVISTLYIDDVKALVADSLQLKNSIINAAPASIILGSPVGSPVPPQILNTGWQFPGTVIGDRRVPLREGSPQFIQGSPSPDYDWINPSNALADDGSDATATYDGPMAGASRGLAATNFTFGSPDSLLPTNAQVDGIEIRVGDYNASGIAQAWNKVRLILTGSPPGDGTEDKSVELGSIGIPRQTDEAGGATDLWSETITRADVINPDFGFFVAVLNGLPGSVNVDYLQMRVFYHEALAPFMSTNDMSDIKFCTFNFSEGHGVGLTPVSGSPPLTGSPLVPITQNSVGNRFIGYGIDDTFDAAIHNASGKDLTINLTEGSVIAEHTQHNVGSPVFITLVASVTVTITVLDVAGDPIETAQTAVFLESDSSEIINADTNASGVVSDTFGGSTPADVSVRVRKNSPGDTRYFPVNAPATIESTGLSLTITLNEDPIAA